MDYEGAKCFTGHPLEIISEGYGLCQTDERSLGEFWFAWAFSKPAGDRGWLESNIRGRDDEPINAWVTRGSPDRRSQMEIIQADIDAHRSMPFDEERERARLMPV